MPEDRLGVGKVIFPANIDKDLRVALDDFSTRVDDNINHLLDKAATDAGATGGTGSAGAGKQYVSVKIGGVVYKLLHDN